MKKILILVSLIVIGVLGYLYTQEKSKVEVSESKSTSTKVGFVYLTTPG